MIGFAFKFWTMAPAEGDEGFVIENSSNFVFQDETYSNLVMVADIIRRITSGNADLEILVTKMINAVSPNNMTSDTDNRSTDVNPGDLVDVKHEVKTIEPNVKMEPSSVDMDMESEEVLEDKWMEDDFMMIDKKKQAEKMKKVKAAAARV